MSLVAWLIVASFHSSLRDWLKIVLVAMVLSSVCDVDTHIDVELVEWYAASLISS